MFPLGPHLRETHGARQQRYGARSPTCKCSPQLPGDLHYATPRAADQREETEGYGAGRLGLRVIPYEKSTAGDADLAKSTFAGNLEAAATRGHIVVYGLAEPGCTGVPEASFADDFWRRFAELHADARGIDAARAGCDGRPQGRLVAPAYRPNLAVVRSCASAPAPRNTPNNGQVDPENGRSVKIPWRTNQCSPGDASDAPAQPLQVVSTYN